MINELLIALEGAQNNIESEEFLNLLLRGGYEIEVRNIIYENLPINQNFAIEFDVPNTNCRADLVRHPNIEIAEFGHNGTWQTQTANTGLVNKVNSDIRKYIDVPEISALYIVGFLTDIAQINFNELNRINTYIDAKINLTRQTANDRIIFVANHLVNMSIEHGFQCETLDFHNNHNGFIVNVKVFILGPFHNHQN